MTKRIDVDSNGNEIFVSDTDATFAGVPVVVARLADDPSTGYLAACETDGSFGSPECLMLNRL